MPNPVLDRALERRVEAQKELDETLEAPNAEKRGLTEDETGILEWLNAELDELDRQIPALKESEARKAAAAKAAAEIEAAGPSAPEHRGAVIRREPGVYRRDASRDEPSYLRDLAAFMVPMASSLGIRPEDARQRLARNWEEVQRDADQGDDKAFASRIVNEVRRWGQVPDVEQRVNPNTTAGTGGEFVPPLWLVSQYVPYARAGRAAANRVTNVGLPPGIDVINIPKITTGSLTAIQVANAAPVTSQDIVTSTVSGKVNTIAGQEDISLQLLEQSPIAMDNVVFEDLSADYDRTLDQQVIYGSGSNGQHQGVLTQTGATSNTTITDINLVTGTNAQTFASTPGSATTLMTCLGNAKTVIETLRFASPTAIWAHPRRVNNWEVQGTDSTYRPLFVSYSPWNAYGPNSASTEFEGVAGALAGLPVIKDANIGTTWSSAGTSPTGSTYDVVAVLKEDDVYLYESTVRLRALPEILSGTLQIRYQLYAYSAFIPSRFPPSISVITGLGAPTF